MRRVLLKRGYAGSHHEAAPNDRSHLMEWVDRGTLDGQSVLAGYCYLPYQQYGTFEEVVRGAKLDRRTVKKYIQR